MPPLNKPELEAARDALRRARMLALQVRALFLNAGDYSTAARLKDVAERVADEIGAIELAIQAMKP
jgi:hypothetical protein